MATTAINAIAKTVDERPDVLDGRTYKRHLTTSDGTEVDLFVTVCEQEGQPFEVFLNCSDAKLTEFTGVAMILASRLLRAGVSMDLIAEDLEAIHSPFTGHFSSVTASYCPSLAAAIGQVLRQHVSD